MWVKKQQLEPDMEQQIGSKLGKEYVKAVYCYLAYLTYTQSTSREITGLDEAQSSSDRSLSRVQFFVTPWTAARPASLSITNPRSLLKHMSIASVMPSNHLILCRPLLLPPSIFPSIRVFFSELVLPISQPKN